MSAHESRRPVGLTKQPGNATEKPACGRPELGRHGGLSVYLNKGAVIVKRVSSFCSNGIGVEVEVLADCVKMRNNEEANGHVLTFTHEEWKAFTLGVGDGEFDVENLPPYVLEGAVPGEFDVTN